MFPVTFPVVRKNYANRKQQYRNEEGSIVINYHRNKTTSFHSFRQLLLAAALIFGSAALFDGTARAEDNGLIIKQSDFSVGKTIDRLGIAMQRKGIKVFARINHAKAAMSIGKDLAPSEVIIFGSPKIGTPLMQSDLKIGVDLPLKAMAWKDVDGQVKLAYTDPVWLAKRFGITNRDKVFKKMAGALNKFTDMATKRGGLPKQ
ncbi:MAG: DUF302 domain-containing protein [Rhodospirillaceae bacterium]|nr:DUF302 domain-containing protein [Rhodospirillaceae bacterium]